MSVRVSCKGCKATLKVPDQFAGKKVKCPKCHVSVAVPGNEDGDDEEFVACEVMPDERIKGAPSSKKLKSARPRRDDDDDDDDRDDRRSRVKADPDRDRERARERDRDRDDRRGRFREEDDDDRRRRKSRRDDDEDDRGKRGDFKPCPRCRARGAKRVLWTAWGSFYGPAMFTHVRCPECGYCYNGRTGRSNLLAAIIFVSVPLIGIGAIIGGIIYMLVARGHL
jgi:hypothetical protein